MGMVQGGNELALADVRFRFLFNEDTPRVRSTSTAPWAYPGSAGQCTRRDTYSDIVDECRRDANECKSEGARVTNPQQLCCGDAGHHGRGHGEQ